MTYDQIIEAKLKRPRDLGFEPHRPLNAALFDWQKLLVTWALRRGRAAFFQECGLGKTIQQLEWGQMVAEHCTTAAKSGRVLILCPLGVRHQTIREGEKFGYVVNPVRCNEDVKDGLSITNYEKAQKLDLTQFDGVVLDESSILKGFNGKTRAFLTAAFSQTPFRLCCTATPAPNDHTELGQHAEFLGVLSASEMLATWFVNDTADTGTWRLKGHARKDFWRWLSTWAACVTKPSDLGDFSDEGFILPRLRIETIDVHVEGLPTGDGELFRMPEISASNLHTELRLTSSERVKVISDHVNASKDSFIVWCLSNSDSDALRKAIPDAVEVKGSDDEDDKESRLDAFSIGTARVLVTKASIAGFGLNFQHCNNHFFCGMNYSFEDFYQAVRRGYRFGQKKEFNCFIVQADTMSETTSTIYEKMKKFTEMQTEMKLASDCISQDLKSKMTCNTSIRHESGKHWRLYEGDCVRVAKLIEDESIDFSVFSPPFANLFVYSDDAQDMGNCANEDEFGEQFKFLVKELYRVTLTGRLCAVHCVDLISTKWKDGEIELKDFSGRIVNWFREENWLLHSRITIWKDPVTEMQRTKALGLLHKQLLKDSAMSRVGNPEYLLIFRKPGVNPKPISHTREDYPVQLWQKDASPVWMDIDQGRTLNGKMARDSNDERHICPLQLSVIERALRLWSSPGDMVYSPFTGIGSEGYTALKMKRRFVGSELKPSYWKHACDYLKAAEAESEDLFSNLATT